MDHDRLFKELLTTFFVEFVQLFLPDVASYLDPMSIEFLDKEVFTDVTAGAKHEVDLLVKAHFQAKETFFLVHVEHQAKAQADFPKRMFTYFARLHEKYDLPVYPIVLYSHKASKKREPSQYKVTFPNKTVLQFDYASIQLGLLSWREYVSKPNPVASALMAKMKIDPQDRPKVRLECLRLLATLKIDPARSQLIGGFIGNYLKLNSAEQEQYEQEYEKLSPEEKEATMNLVNPWVQEGRQEGRQQGLQEGRQEGRQQGLQEGRQEGRHDGKAELVVHLLNRVLGTVPTGLQEQLGCLSSEHLDALGIALFDFKTVSDLETWLAQANA